ASDGWRDDRAADQARCTARWTLQPEPDWITLGHCPSQINSLGSKVDHAVDAAAAVDHGVGAGRHVYDVKLARGALVRIALGVCVSRPVGRHAGPAHRKPLRELAVVEHAVGGDRRFLAESLPWEGDEPCLGVERAAVLLRPGD